VCFQLESLKRIDVDTKFDIFLMDEYSLTVAHAYSETGGSHDTSTGTIMRQLLEICGRSIILGADITQAQIQGVQKIRRSPGRVVVNKHEKWFDCTVDIQAGKASIPHVCADLWANTTKQPYHESLVCSNSSNRMRTIQGGV
jgi:hypothetical protein